MNAIRTKVKRPHDTFAPAPAKPWRVLLRVGGHECLYSRYADHDSAALVVSRMHRHGFGARVIKPDPETT